MKAKEAIAQAKALLGDFYAGEILAEVRLEEVEFDEPSDSWLITLGILRPRIENKSNIVAQVLGPEMSLARTFKLLKIPNSPIKQPSMKIRELQTEE